MHKVYTKLDRIAGNVISLEADDVTYRELAMVESAQGASLAQVIRIEGNRVFLQVFAGGRGISTAAEVRFLGRVMQVPFSDALLGRIFTGSGDPRMASAEKGQRYFEGVSEAIAEVIVGLSGAVPGDIPYLGGEKATGC